MSFADFALHPLVLKSLDGDGYAEPTPVQAAAIGPALAGRDVLATAATGTGKTAAFLLPALTRIAADATPAAPGAPRVLVLAPTRELAMQVAQAARRHGRFLRLAIVEIMGGTPYRVQLNALARPVDVVIATPGRLIDHLERGRIALDRVATLVLDEADRMLDLGFADAVDRIAAACAGTRQTMLFTATLDRRMAALAGRLLADPVRVAPARDDARPAIDQRLYLADHLAHKLRLVQHFAVAPELAKAIVFVATKRDCDALADELANAGHRAKALHGDMDQRERARTMDRLRSGDVRILVATDVAARGIDVRDISHVINFDLPRTAEDYVHRIGRTGRAGAAGVAISLVGPADRALVQAIERFTGQRAAFHVVAGLEPSARAQRPERRPYGERPRRERPQGERPPGERPQGQRPGGGRPQAHPGQRPGQDRPGHKQRPWRKPARAAQGTRPR
jgi:superfamily II DNA/RNA helicase